MRITSFFCTLLFWLFTKAVIADAQQLIDQIRADYSVLLAAKKDFHARRERGILNGTEASDYAGYIARLQRQLAEDCRALIQLQTESVNQHRKHTGEGPQIDQLCPQQSPLVQPAPIDQVTEHTRAEQIAELDAEFNAGLGEFDELLLREQQRVKAATPPQRHSDGAAGGSGQGGDQNEFGENAAGTQNDSADASDKSDGDSNAQMSGINNSQSRGARGGADSARQVAKGQPPDIPDGSDDDVVARQLREAAEKETDPELKKKLWEEYKKYKRGTR